MPLGGDGGSLCRAHPCARFLWAPVCVPLAASPSFRRLGVGSLGHAAPGSALPRPPRPMAFRGAALSCVPASEPGPCSSAVPPTRVSPMGPVRCRCHPGGCDVAPLRGRDWRFPAAPMLGHAGCASRPWVSQPRVRPVSVRTASFCSRAARVLHTLWRLGPDPRSGLQNCLCSLGCRPAFSVTFLVAQKAVIRDVQFPCCVRCPRPGVRSRPASSGL